MLSLFCALALVALLAGPSYAEVQNVKISGNIDVNALLFDQLDLTKTDEVSSYFMSTVGVQIDADLTDNVAATIKLLNERDWDAEADATTDVDLDLAYLTIKEMFYSPLTITIGRQMLVFGNSLVVADPDTNDSVATADVAFGDLSAKKGFDSVRLTLDYDPLIIDGIFAKVNEDFVGNNDEDLYGVNVSYDMMDYDADIEGYFFAKHDKSTNPSNEVDVLGIKMNCVPMEYLTLNTELAFQFGDYSDGSNSFDREAWAADIGCVYEFVDSLFTPSVNFKYAFRSGEENDSASTGDYEAWDVMYESQTMGLLANHNFGGNNDGVGSNCHIINLGGEIEPLDDVTVSLNWYHYWLAEKFNAGSRTADGVGGTFTMTSDESLGDEIDIELTYDYTEDVEFSLTTAFFVPGDAFEGDNSETSTAVAGGVSVSF
jgi:hypothetical protein